MRAYKTGLISACLALLLTGCASTPDPVTRTEVVKITPPIDLMQPCPVPEPGALKTNAALQDWTISLVEALRACDADKTGLRQWSQAGPEEAPVQ